MTTTTGPTQHRHKVGMCPACRSGLWAELEIVVDVHDPSIREDGTPRAFVTPRYNAMRLDHFCQRNENGEWTYPNGADQ